MNLLKYGKFTSHAGKELDFKIECDALTDDDWECIAKLISDRCKFGRVYGVPSGGVKLQKALEKYITPNNPYRLVVDDVWTTGKSMMEAMENGDVGFVVFARERVMFDAHKYVRALFTMDML